MGQDGARREIRQAFHPSGASGVSIPGSGWGKLSMRHVCPAIFPYNCLEIRKNRVNTHLTDASRALNYSFLPGHASCGTPYSWSFPPFREYSPFSPQARTWNDFRATGVREGRTNTSVLPGAPALFSPSPSAGAEWRARMRSHPSVSRASHR